MGLVHDALLNIFEVAIGLRLECVVLSRQTADLVGTLLNLACKDLYIVTVLLTLPACVCNCIFKRFLLLRRYCILFQLVRVLIVEHLHVSAYSFHPVLQALMLRRKVVLQLTHFLVEHCDVILYLREGLLMPL